jgi:hypothetical protein
MKNPLEKLEGAILLGIAITVVMVLFINVIHAGH